MSDPRQDDFLQDFDFDSILNEFTSFSEAGSPAPQPAPDAGRDVNAENVVSSEPDPEDEAFSRFFSAVRDIGADTKETRKAPEADVIPPVTEQMKPAPAEEYLQPESVSAPPLPAAKQASAGRVQERDEFAESLGVEAPANPVEYESMPFGDDYSFPCGPAEKKIFNIPAPGENKRSLVSDAGRASAVSAVKNSTARLREMYGIPEKKAPAVQPSEKDGEENAAPKKLPSRKQKEPPKEQKERKSIFPDEIEPEPPKEKKPKKTKSEKRKGKIAAIVFAGVAVILAGAVLFAADRLSASPYNLPNVYVGDVFVGNLTKEQTLSALDAAGWDELTASDLTVTLAADEKFVVNPCRAGVILPKETAVEEACSYGHDRGIFQNLFTYVTNLFTGVDINELHRNVGADYINECIDAGISSLNERLGDGSYVVDAEAEKLYMVKGAGQIDIDNEALYTLIESALLDGAPELEFRKLRRDPVSPDFAAIYEELDCEVADAFYCDDHFNITPEIVGCTFDTDEARSLWEAAGIGETVEIPLQVTLPEITEAELSARLFRDVLGEQVTLYTNSSDNRINNLNLAAEKINGVIIYPGELFSYNETVGQRTEAAGFLPAGAYLDGEVVEEIGGGVCQVSSTLYSALLYAQAFKEPVERVCHYFKVDYLDYCMDATVSIPAEGKAQDFKFRNEREYPIMIVAECNNEDRCIRVQILGTDVDGSYVTMRRETFTIPHPEFGFDVPIGLSVHQYRDRYSADGTLIETLEYGYNDEYYLHEEAYADRLAAARAAAEMGGGGEGDEG